MILIVKEKGYKAVIRKVLAFSALIIMFSFYYNHMSTQFQEQNASLEKKLKEETSKLKKKYNLTKKLERLIYKEAEECVELLGQEKIQSIKIVKNKLYIVCDWNTDTEPLFVRYGVLALVKSTPQSIKIAISLKYIVESKYES